MYFNYVHIVDLPGKAQVKELLISGKKFLWLMSNIRSGQPCCFLFSKWEQGSVRLNSICWKLHDEIRVDSRKRDRGSLTSKRVQLLAIGLVLVASSTFNKQGPEFSLNMVFFCYCLITNGKGGLFKQKGASRIMMQSMVSWASLSIYQGL